MELIEYLKIIVLGIVEGITEWLPISSTGHLIIFDEFMKLNMSEDFKEMFDVVIQLGAIFAVIVIYFWKLLPLKFANSDSAPAKADKQTAKKASGSKATNGKVSLDMDKIIMWCKIIVAVLPAALIGIPFDDKIDAMFYNPVTVAITLIVYGIAFIVIERYHKGKAFSVNDISEITFKQAIIIGAFQVLALIPGTSRSGATIVGAMLIGISRVAAAEFTFYLAIPVMFGASLLKLLKFGLAFTASEAIALGLGMVVAFVVSVIAIKFLMGYIKKHDFKVFGVYRIILGVIIVITLVL